MVFVFLKSNIVQEFNTKILILSHEKDNKYLLELLEHLQVSLKDVKIFTGKEILPSENKVDKLWQELNSSNILLTIISSHYYADDLLFKLHSLGMEMHDSNILEAVQIIARSVYPHPSNTTRPVKAIPKTPLANLKNRDEAYSEIVEFVLDKIELIKTHYELLKEKLRVQALERKIKELLGE